MDDPVLLFEDETSTEPEDLPVPFDVDTFLLPLELLTLSVSDPFDAPVFLTVAEISFDSPPI
jgi:hypothetical protein